MREYLQAIALGGGCHLSVQSQFLTHSNLDLVTNMVLSANTMLALSVPGYDTSLQKSNLTPHPWFPTGCFYDSMSWYNLAFWNQNLQFLYSPWNIAHITKVTSLCNKPANDSLLSSSLQLWPVVLSMQLFLYLAGCAINDSRNLPLLLQAPNNSSETDKNQAIAINLTILTLSIQSLLVC